MTTPNEQPGTFSMQLELELTVGECRKLAHIVHVQASDPSDVVSSLVASAEPVAPRDVKAQTLPMRVYLLPEQRSDLLKMAEQLDCRVDNLVSAMVAHELAALPEITEPAVQQNPEAPRTLQHDLQRLKARRKAAGAAIPPWLDAYIEQLENQ